MQGMIPVEELANQTARFGEYGVQCLNLDIPETLSDSTEFIRAVIHTDSSRDRLG